MFFKVATSLVATLFLGLLVVGLRQRSWLFVIMNFLGTALNVAVLLMDVWGQLNMTILLCATPALAIVLAADIVILFREPAAEKKPASAQPDQVAVAGHETPQNFYLVTNEKRLHRELNRCTKLSTRQRELALKFWRQGNETFLQGQARAAADKYLKSLKVAPAPSSLSNLAAALLVRNEPQAALSHCAEALALDPEHLETWLQRSRALLQLEQPQEALAACEQAVALQPNFIEAWISRGNILTQLGQIEASLESYDTALRLNPNRPECWNNRGVALSKLGKFQEARSSFERTLQIQPLHFPAVLNRALVLDRLGRIEQAKKHYRHFLQQPPAAMNGHLALVRSRLQQLENGSSTKIDLTQLTPELAL